jgi:hypothetical protein
MSQITNDEIDPKTTQEMPMVQVNWLSENPMHTIARCMPSGMQYNLTKDQWQTVLSIDDLNWFLNKHLFELKIKNRNFSYKTWSANENLYLRLLQWALQNEIPFYDEASHQTFKKVFNMP